MFPFIFIKSEEFLQPWLINHERIHFRQQIELLFVGSFLINFIEKIYARFFKNKTKFNSYLYISAEQEAYLNQNNPDYLKTRKLWAQFYYVKNKKTFNLGKSGEVLF